MAATSSDTDVLSFIHQSAKKGTLLASSHQEVKELMHQIDMFISTKSHDKIDSLKHQVDTRDKELASVRSSLHERDTEIKRLRTELNQSNHSFKVKFSDQETQLLRQRSELNRLKKCYKNLKSKSGKLSEVIHVDDSEVLKESVQKQLEFYEEQLNKNSDSIKELEHIIIMKEKEIEKLKVDLQKSLIDLKEKESLLEKKEHYYQSILEDKEKKLISLKRERDESRLQTKNALMESEKWYQQLQQLQEQTKELGVANTKFTQLQDTIEKMNKEKHELNKTIEILHESLTAKDMFIKNLEEQYSEKLQDEEMHYQQELKTLKMTLKTLNMDKKKLIDENKQLKKKRSSLGSPIESELKAELGKRESEINDYHLQLMKRDTQVQSLQERVSHLEDLLSEATTELNSHQNSISEGNTLDIHTNDTVEPSKELVTENATVTTSSLSKMEQINGTAVISSKGLVMEEFQKKLNCIMSEHFSQLDQSIQKALNHSFHI